MSVKASWFQIGLSGTANLNFHWRNLLDGVLRLTRGNAGAPITDVMRVKADNSVEFPGNVASGVLGAGQTWQDVTGSRIGNTTYTNTTGKPIQLIVSFYNGSSNMYVTVNGAAVYAGSSVLNGAQAHSNIIIPTAATYSVSGSSTFNGWWELR